LPTTNGTQRRKAHKHEHKGQMDALKCKHVCMICGLSETEGTKLEKYCFFVSEDQLVQ